MDIETYDLVKYDKTHYLASKRIYGFYTITVDEESINVPREMCLLVISNIIKYNKPPKKKERRCSIV